MNLERFNLYATIATLIVIPFLAAFADALYGAAQKYNAYTATTPSKADDVRARRLLQAARGFLGFIEWFGPLVGKAIPLVRRYVQDAPRETVSTPSLERAEADERDPTGGAS